ncbi:MAG: flagellar basal-body rod protein FlgB [Gammaproteobacteria bacterium TMED30]|jgi:flagellar basal-body rod protein FlgB|nr:flagellar basal body rod protein FlgB [Gammaproteobacteria bacterium]OUU06726.1 MAG: flagellar basal-body rod protein FlgB [Gammaproteobacteria bacterium TMED30]|tara:strand:- start:1961 stop:2341 length:381 start_codon:yes stop_codon:yes gene_type:complete
MDAYNDIFGTTAKALDLRSKRMELISSNIANADVVGYKAKDMDFKKLMSKEMSGALNNTHAKHLGGVANGKTDYIYRVPINPSENGNTVEMNYEQAQFGRESTRYAATLQFLESRVGGLRRALRGE